MRRDTPITRHLMRVAGAAASSPVASARRADLRAHDLMRAKLATDQRRLKSVQSITRKIEIKREVLPEYAPYVSEVTERDAGGQDDVLVTLLVWRIDAGDFVGALDIARYAIRHGLAMPEHYERTLPATVAEGFADSEGVPDAILGEALDLTMPFDMVDQIRAKLFKAYGLALAASDKPAALDLLRRAIQMNDRIGVKRDIARLEAQIAEDNSASRPLQGGVDA
ncbi:MAG: phage terminase small subunit [Burkholderia gladioli]